MPGGDHAATATDLRCLPPRGRPALRRGPTSEGTEFGDRFGDVRACQGTAEAGNGNVERQVA